MPFIRWKTLVYDYSEMKKGGALPHFSFFLIIHRALKRWNRCYCKAGRCILRLFKCACTSSTAFLNCFSTV